MPLALSIRITALTAAMFCAAPVLAQTAAPEQASAQQITIVQPQDRAEAFAKHPLAPFSAEYEVYNEGKRLGNATMQLVSAGNGRWRIDLRMRGTGLLRLAGLNADQSIVFEERAGQLRPISQATTQNALMRQRRHVGVFNWNTMQAVWRGDVRANRQAPVALRNGDMPGLVMNLAMIRDASPGVRLQYRNVDTGRAREQVFQAAASTSHYEVAGIGYDAVHLQRGNSQDGTEVWVADNVPTPLRVLQHDDGKLGVDMRLIEYK